MAIFTMDEEAVENYSGQSLTRKTVAHADFTSCTGQLQALHVILAMDIGEQRNGV